MLLNTILCLVKMSWAVLRCRNLCIARHMDRYIDRELDCC